MHRYFKSAHKAPQYGFFVVLQTPDKAFRVPEKNGADHFDQLVALVVAQAANVGYKIPGSSRDHVANLICRRDPGFCTQKAVSGTADLIKAGTVPAVHRASQGSCGSCGGGKIR